MDKENKIAARFKLVRGQLGLTQHEMARRLLISRNYIAKIEAGIQEPSMRVIRDLESFRVLFENKQSTREVHIREVKGSSSEICELLRADILIEMERLIKTVGNDPGRLGWIRVELRALFLRLTDDGHSKTANESPLSGPIPPSLQEIFDDKERKRAASKRERKIS